MAELVVADAPYKTYPGGVIVLKCDEWMAGARGSLSSASDSLACTGTRVRDTQTVSTSILDDVFTAYTEAADTLEVPLAGIPFEPGMGYNMYVSYRTPGDWDVTDNDQLEESTQARFSGVVALGFHGLANAAPDENNPIISFEFGEFGARRGVPYYATEQLGGDMDFFAPESTDTLIVRAFAQDGSTAEWLLDQIILVPYVTFGSINGWGPEDFRIVGGDVSGDPGMTNPVADGADGGDDNGKFTWNPNPGEQLAPADYQKKASSSGAEYMLRVVEDDGLELVNSGTGGQASAHAYLLHGAHYDEAGEYVNDDFSRTIALAVGSGDQWGDSPQGFGWATTIGTPIVALMGVDGSEGRMFFKDGTSATLQSTLGLVNDGTGAQLFLSDQWTFSGKWRIDAATWIDVTTGASIQQRFLNGNLQFAIRFDPVDKEWDFVYVDGATTGVLHGPVDVSSWYADGLQVGFRMEMRRHLIRVRVWDATGAEPGTWDYEDFKPVLSGTVQTYPYSDDPLVAVQGYLPNYLNVLATIGAPADDIEVAWDDIVVDHTPEGDPDDIGASVEQPEGNEVGSITVPYGAAHFVYWGSRNWTDGFGGTFNLDFSSKAWSATTAADLQRAETSFFYFRTIHGGIVSMLWTSSTPVDITRIHA